MWWTGQNLDLIRTARSGKRWHFRVWHDQVEGVYIQRIFFWDDARSETGVVEFRGPATIHVTRLRDAIRRLVSHADYRCRHATRLEFPVEKAYAAYAKLENERSRGARLAK